MTRLMLVLYKEILLLCLKGVDILSLSTMTVIDDFSIE